MRTRFALLLAACAAALAHAAPTQLCNTASSSEVWFYGMDAATQSRLADVVTRPQTDPELYRHLWEPIGVRTSTSVLGNRSVILRMDPFQDVREIVAAMRADPALQGLGSIEENGAVCFAASPPPPMGVATEYHNTILDHYFLSTSDAENAIIDAGGAGPGWERTGETFRFAHFDPCSGDPRVFRFYAPSARSHFFTADAAECGGLRGWDSGWIGEGVAFGAVPAQNGSCPSTRYTKLYRLYNNRAAFNDSNHRYTKSPAIYQEMIAKGWVGEGVALCVRDNP